MDIEKDYNSSDKEHIRVSAIDLDPILSQHAQEYALKTAMSTPVAMSEGHRLKRDLQARHLSMIAIGGALGTGLIIGTGSALANAGPASILISYTLVGFMVWMVMVCLGEMATYIALPEGFGGYATRYCSKHLGFTVGWCYVLSGLLSAPNHMTAGALVMQYWVDRDRINPGVWITIFLVLCMVINVVGVKFFGEFEFYLSAFKVVVIVGLIILMICITAGVGRQDAIGFHYYHDPGAFKEYSETINGSKGKFVAFVTAFVNAVYAYQGTELVGVTAAEAFNPRRAVPRAMKLTIYRIAIFYIVSVFMLGLCVAYNDPLLLTATHQHTSASASPFVVAIRNAGIPALPHILNACILLFVFSASNSDIYIASRTLYALAADGKAPAILGKTLPNGVPYVGLIVAFLFSLLGYMNIVGNSATIFSYLVNVGTIFGLLTWISILVVYLFFRKALKAQGIERSSLTYSAPLQPYGAYIAIFLCSVISLIKNFTVFMGGSFDYKDFITGYIGLPVFFFFFVASYLVRGGPLFTPPEEVDLVTYKDVIDAEEEEYNYMVLEKQARRREKGFKKDKEWFYDTFIGWLF